LTKLVESAGIKEIARNVGFSHCGVARAEPLEELREGYLQFIGSGRNATLGYLERYMEQRLHPELLLPCVRSIITVLLNYLPHPDILPDDSFIIARYARGEDYHLVMKEKLHAMANLLKQEYGHPGIREFVDSGPVLEKVWAQRCGLGWQGKNTLLIRENEGSWFFIGILLTTLEIESDNPAPDRCGSCTRCMEACPTGALTAPGKLEISRCHSYHTIENRGVIPYQAARLFPGRIYGCDICQEVCPHNRAVPGTKILEFQPIPELLSLTRKEWSEMNRETFDRIFRNSTIKRTGFDTFQRNIRLTSPEKEA